MLGNVAGREIHGQHGALGAEGPCKRRRQGREKHRRARAMLHAGIAVRVRFRIGCFTVRVGAVIMVGLRLRGGDCIRDGAEADGNRGKRAQRHQRKQRDHDEKCCGFSHGGPHPSTGGQDDVVTNCYKTMGWAAEFPERRRISCGAGGMPTTHTHPSAPATRHADHRRMAGHHYRRLLVMAALSFASMYVLMYAMVDRFANVYPNFNQLYMAGLMTAPMVIIEMALMRGMYQDGKLNALIVAGGLIALVLLWGLIRQQTAVSDRQFLKSMIPHHASAILMCEKATLRDAEIKALCAAIVSSQASEIAQMKAKLAALDRGA